MSLRVSARLNDQGALVSSDLYDAYGQLRAGNPNNDPVGYCGQWGYYTDHSTGYILCTYRWYDPTTARWLTRDPIEYEGGLNLYGYVGGNPVGWADPLGLSKWTLPKGAGGLPIAEPYGVSVDKNIQLILDMAKIIYTTASAPQCSNWGAPDPTPWFLNQVRHLGEWDYKNMANPRDKGGNPVPTPPGGTSVFEPFGNFNYGATAAAMGWSLDFALYGAHAAQFVSGIFNGIGSTIHGRLPDIPHFDDWKDQKNVRLGYEYFQQHYGSRK